MHLGVHCDQQSNGNIQVRILRHPPSLCTRARLVMVLMYFSERVSEPTPVRQVLLSVLDVAKTDPRHRVVR